MKKCVGVDLGGTTVKMGILGEDGTIFEKWEIPTRKEESGKYILSDIAASAKEHLAAAGIADEDFVGVGIGVPGPVRSNGYVEVCVNLGWKDINPAAELSKLMGGVPVKAGNDANVAALGEQWMGSGKGHDSLMFYTLGTGVGGGLIIDGKIVAGSKGMGAEVGHMTVNPHEKDCCNCGNHGCLEQYASATGIVKEMKRTLASDEAGCVLCGRDFSCKDVLDAAKAGDALAEKTVKRCMNYLAMSMSWVTYVADPEVFVIGGGVSKAGDYLVDMLQSRYNELTPLSSKKAEIFIASLSNDAGMYGAAKLVL
ncbi:MAG: ROK family glucokinase [Lachnospiraceae bacterium]|nr:ROK family glucokinase [Lachnospiraceae bacterium]MDY4969714.1 ROK family glucokinase [Lachnospiraceae bacterium]